MAKSDKQEQKLDVSERAQSVLSDVVDLYGTTGKPVGSGALAEYSKLSLSSPSIRLVMQDLEKMGLLTHPHTSAGRMPTEEGYRYYVKNLVQADEVDAGLKKKIESQLTGKKELTVAINDVSKTLSELTGCAGLVTAPTYERDTLESVEFVRLSNGKVLAIIVKQSGEIENRVVEVPDFVSIEDLNKSSSELKKIVAGQSLKDARSALMATLSEQKGRINEMVDQMMSAAAQWGEPTVSDGALVIAGSDNLFQYPELVRERLQGLVKMFEEKRLLMALMEEVQRGEGVQIFVGKDCPVEVAQDCAVIAGSYGDKDKKTIGTLGVIGPMRMNYRQTIGLVDFTSKLLSKVVSEQGGAHDG